MSRHRERGANEQVTVGKSCFISEVDGDGGIVLQRHLTTSVGSPAVQGSACDTKNSWRHPRFDSLREKSRKRRPRTRIPGMDDEFRSTMSTMQEFGRWQVWDLGGVMSP